MNSGVPPTARKARTGELTPPGMTRQARSYSSAERGCRDSRAAPSGSLMSVSVVLVARLCPGPRRRRAAGGARRLGRRKKRLDGIRAGVQRRGAQARERQVRQPVRHGARQPLELAALPVVKCTQLMGQCTRHFLGGDALEGAAQLGQLRADGARGEFGAQARESLVDGRAHRG